jgi:hypothetical protein
MAAEQAGWIGANGGCTAEQKQKDNCRMIWTGGANMTRLEITRAEVREILRANLGKQLCITFDNGIMQSVEIGAVDDEGFLHSGSYVDQPGLFWRRFEEVKHIERKMTPCAESMPNSCSIAAPKWVTAGLRRKRRSLFR